MNKLFIPLITAILLTTLLVTPTFAQSDTSIVPLPAGTASPRDWGILAPEGSLLPLKISGDSAILIDAYTGKVLFEKDADTRRYPASTTKIMTCLIALESGKQLDGLVTIGVLPALDFAKDSENIDLKKGETLTFGDLLAGMMVKSGNDAADAVAIYVSGSIKKFVEKMNQRAQELEMTKTHYTCTNGLTNDTEHYTTSRDMAKLTMEAIKYPEFTKLVRYSTYTIKPTNKTASSRKLASTNKLLGNGPYSYVYAAGIKTGYTSMAQNALVSSANKDGMSLIAVDMHVDIRNNMWKDCITMFEYGFKFFGTKELNKLLTSQPIQITVKNASSNDSSEGNLMLVQKAHSTTYLTDRKEVLESMENYPSLFQQELSITKDTAPIKLNEIVGAITYYYEGNSVLTCDLLASRDVEMLVTPTPAASVVVSSKETSIQASRIPAITSKPVPQKSEGDFSEIIWISIALMLIVLLIFVVWFYTRINRGKRYHQYNYRRNNHIKIRK